MAMSTMSTVRHSSSSGVSEILYGDARLSIERVQSTPECEKADERTRRSNRLAAIGEKIASISHEVRNELHAIQVGFDLLSEAVAGQPTACKWLAPIRDSRDRLSRLFEDLREFAAPPHLDSAYTSLVAVWRRAWDALAPQRQGRQANLVETQEGSSLADVDAFRMEQVFRNLLENSLAACRDPVRISIASTEVEQDGRAFIVIGVRDNGPGLTREQYESAFEAFFTTKSRGTGLGLPIARQLIEAHGGTISLEASPEPGAQFVIRLPKFQIQRSS